jgi:hypothetical protein
MYSNPAVVVVQVDYYYQIGQEFARHNHFTYKGNIYIAKGGFYAVADTAVLMPIGFSFTVGAPVYGCTDPAAWNYNPNATENDGSCLYTNLTERCPMPASFGQVCPMPGDFAQNNPAYPTFTKTLAPGA